jgi:hypothetical protein
MPDTDAEESSQELGDEIKESEDFAPAPKAKKRKRADDDEGSVEGEDNGDPTKKKRGRKVGSTKLAIAKRKGVSGLGDEGSGESQEKKAKKGKSSAVKRVRGKIVNGQKHCRPCKKWHDVAAFADGSAQCGPMRQAMQNLTTAAAHQGQMEWWKSVQEDEDQLNKVCNNYRVRIGVAGGASKAGAFPILQYIEEVKRERLLIGYVHAQPFNSFIYNEFVES